MKENGGRTLLSLPLVLRPHMALTIVVAFERTLAELTQKSLRRGCVDGRFVPSQFVDTSERTFVADVTYEWVRILGVVVRRSIVLWFGQTAVLSSYEMLVR